MGRSAGAVALGLLVASGCASHGNANGDASSTLAFTVDAPVGGENYECFGFDAAPLAGRWVRGIRWTPPPAGLLHHAALYAYAQDYPDGPVPCTTMPVAWTMHIWAPGGDSLTLPDDVAIELPTGTRRFVVQAHVLRAEAGPPLQASATIDTVGDAPPHIAAWFPAYGRVPPIPPHSQGQTSTTCFAGAPLHIVSTWPHMHRAGSAFQGAIAHADGTRTVIVDANPWSFDRQSTYLVDRDVAAGDGIETDCTWNNQGNDYLFPGYSTTQEMCGQGLIVWPKEAATWTGCR